MQLLYSKIKFHHQKKKPKSFVICTVYKLIRNILFRFDAESVHYFSMNALRFFRKIPLLSGLLHSLLRPANSNPVHAMGLQFKNPIGLGAGFDKNARYLKELEMLGFGFVEIGTVTPVAQKGNETPRLFRLPKDKAIINRMGFNNEGADAIAHRLQNWKRNNSNMLIGANIGKNKITKNEDAWIDYETCFLKLQPLVDYVVVNVSSPNTPGLRDLQQRDVLKKILGNLMDHNAKMDKEKPLLLKISPDLDKETLDQIISLCLEIKLHGLIVSNTTISRDNLLSEKNIIEKIGAGGLSGKPLQQSSTELVAYVHEKLKNQMLIIASGGIFNAEDVKQIRNAGGSLFQVWTGFIYEGPFIVKNILQ